MSAAPTVPARIEAVHDPRDEAAVRPILADLSKAGLDIGGDAAAPHALLAFLSRAALTAGEIAPAIRAAHERGTPVVPVLLEPLTLPGDATDDLAPALTGTPVIAYYQPEDEKRRGILRALALFGIGTGAAGVADAASFNSANATPTSATSAQTTSAAPTVKASATAKADIAVVKASSKLSVRALAYGGAAVTTALVIAAVIVTQRDREPPAAPASTQTASAATSTAPSAQPADGTPNTPRPTPTEIDTGAARVILQQESYPVGVPIPVRVTGMPGHNNDYVAIAAAGSPGYGEVRYEYLRGRKDADIILRGVMKPGDYEVRLFFGNDQDRSKSDQIRFAIPLKITLGPDVVLKTETPSFVEGRPIRVTYEGMPGNEKDWIATAEADSDDNAYIAYVYTNGATSGTAELRPLAKPGRYEIRVHFDDSTADRTVQARLPFEVTAAPPVVMQLDALNYAPGATVTLSFNTMPGNQRDWFALSRAGDDGYLTYQYTDGQTSGTLTFRAPDEPGAYEVRAYFDDTSNDRTIRATSPFIVGPGSP